MLNKCKDCGICCLDTEMSLSMQDIKYILDNYPDKINKKEFSLKVTKNHYLLKNIDGHCYFFNNKKKTCRIYEFRPQGCKFYPIIYDNGQNRCIYDSYCPRKNLFHLNKKELKNKCNKVKKYLNEKLKII